MQPRQLIWIFFFVPLYLHVSQIQMYSTISYLLRHQMQYMRSSWETLCSEDSTRKGEIKEKKNKYIFRRALNCFTRERMRQENMCVQHNHGHFISLVAHQSPEENCWYRTNILIEQNSRSKRYEILNVTVIAHTCTFTIFNCYG